MGAKLLVGKPETCRQKLELVEYPSEASMLGEEDSAAIHSSYERTRSAVISGSLAQTASSKEDSSILFTQQSQKIKSKKRVHFANNNTFDYEKSLVANTINDSSLAEVTANFQENLKVANKPSNDIFGILNSILCEDETEEVSHEKSPKEVLAFQVKGNEQVIYCPPLTR